MWTCSKCGEAIEEQFDSCWRCAGQVEPTNSLPAQLTAKRSEYACDLLVSYLIPWVAVLLDAAVFSPQDWRYSVISLRDLPMISLWMLLPGTITFFVMRLFLPYRIGRRLVAAGVCFVWLCLVSVTHVRTGLL
jgi:hypothetical protein